MRRGEIYWADLGPGFERRPACILTPADEARRRTSVSCAVVTRSMRGSETEVPVGRPEGLHTPSIVDCRNVLTVSKTALDRRPVAYLDLARQEELDNALCHALGIRPRWLPKEERVP